MLQEGAPCSPLATGVRELWAIESFPVDAQGPSYLQQERPSASHQQRGHLHQWEGRRLHLSSAQSHKPFLGGEDVSVHPQGLTCSY